MIRRFFRRLFCRHVWRCIAVDWDGVSRVECTKCGKIREFGL